MFPEPELVIRRVSAEILSISDGRNERAELSLEATTLMSLFDVNGFRVTIPLAAVIRPDRITESDSKLTFPAVDDITTLESVVREPPFPDSDMSPPPVADTVRGRSARARTLPELPVLTPLSRIAVPVVIPEVMVVLVLARVPSTIIAVKFEAEVEPVIVTAPVLDSILEPFTIRTP